MAPGLSLVAHTKHTHWTLRHLLKFFFYPSISIFIYIDRDSSILFLIAGLGQYFIYIDVLVGMAPLSIEKCG